METMESTILVGHCQATGGVILPSTSMFGTLFPIRK